MMQDEGETSQSTKEQVTNESGEEVEEHVGPAMQARNVPGFLLIVTFACEALIACAGQMDAMEIVFKKDARDYGSKLARSANAVKVAIKEGRISSERPSIVFRQISRIINKESSGLEDGIYSTFFEAVAKGFCKYPNDKQLTADIWVAVLASAIKVIKTVCQHYFSDMLQCLVLLEYELRLSLRSGLNFIDAFGGAIRAIESICYTDCLGMYHKPYIGCYADAHAVCIWMRAVYEGIKLKFGQSLEL